MAVTGELIAFFLLATLSIGGAIYMINFTNVIHMGVAIAFTFLSISGIYFLLDAQFIGVIQILIYTGAVSILMLFGIMLTKHDSSEKEESTKIHPFLSFLFVAGFLGLVIGVIYRTPMVPGEMDPKGYGINKIGELIFSKYAIPFEVASILLLVALIGAIVLAKREENE